MKHWKTLFIGFAAGAACMVTTSVLGAYMEIRATLLNDALFKIDDKVVASPGDMPVLSYNGYTYVPVRFVAEQMGAEVNWNVVNRQVEIKSPKPQVIEKIVEKPVEKIVYVDKADQEGGETVYEKLPAKAMMDGYTITLKTVIMDDDDDFAGIRRTRANINVENFDCDKVEIQQIDSTLILDGEEFKMSIKSNSWDSKWDNEYVKKDDDMDGYLNFDGIKKDYSTGTLRLRVQADRDGKEIDIVEINFKR